MSDPRNHDHQPDRAALEELMRAFAGEPADAAPDDESGPDNVDVAIVEPDDPVGPAARSRPVIRIDDLGTTAIDPGLARAGEPSSEPSSGPPVEPDIAPPAFAADPTPDPTPPPPSGGAGGEPLVISIDDEELPDAVYVEGSLERDGGGSIVIIEDDTTGDTLGVESEREVRRGIEPRLRERRVAVKRAQGRKRLKWVVLAGAVLVVVVGALAVLGSPLFAIRADRVTLTGNVYADPAAVQAVVDDLVGTPALRADTQAAERDLEAIPWVDDARVRVDFPYAVSIEIRERQAWTTYVGPDGRHRVLDDEGRVLDVLPGYPIAYVLITGPDPVDLDPGEFAPRGYAAASDLAKNLTGSVRTRVDRIDVTADGTRLSLWLDDGTEVRFGEARDLLVKLVRLETVVGSGAELEPGVIDVSTDEVTLPPSRSEPEDG